MKSLHELVSKKWWFVLFNVGTLLALAVSGRLSSLDSAVTSLIALLIVNGTAVISARSFPNWK
jgi:hypothetical protein